jgi:hypothetical protein
VVTTSNLVALAWSDDRRERRSLRLASHRDLGCEEAKAFDELLHAGVVARNMQMDGGLRRLEQAGQP